MCHILPTVLLCLCYNAYKPFRDGTGGNVVKELSDFKKLKYFLAPADELMRTLMIPIGLTPTSISLTISTNWN